MTITFGKIRFLANDPVQRKYAVVDKDEDVKKVLDLMIKEWKLETPNLLISVTGGAKNFSMGERLKEVFRRGLLNVTKSTGAWIVTGGTNKGVMKHVGEALHGYRMTSARKAPIVAIGIATFGIVHGAEDLKNKAHEQKCTVKYSIKTSDDGIYLDSNHTHFILVNDHTRGQFGGEIEFRALLEKEIGELKAPTANVPVVLLVLQGGKNTLRTVKEAVKINTPVVIISGSGQVADVFAYAYQNVRMKNGQTGEQSVLYTFDRWVSEEIIRRLENIDGIGKEHAEQDAKTVEAIIKQKTKYITVYNLCSSIRDTEDIDVAILQSLLKVHQSKLMQLKLALALNTIDIAKNDICKDDSRWMQYEIYDIAQTAILQDKVEFVEMFLDKGMSAKQFLTQQRLLELYKVPQKTPFRTLMQKIKNTKHGDISLEDIGHLIQYLIGDFYVPLYLKKNTYFDMKFKLKSTQAEQMGNTSSCKTGTGGQIEMGSTGKPFRHLFMWCILMNRQDMAKLFWRYCHDKTAAALVGCGILKQMAKKVGNRELEKKLESNASEFSALAIDMLNECNDDEERKTHYLLETPLDDWSDDTCLHLAVETDNKEFISHAACQSLLNKIWKGKLAQQNSNWMVFFSVIFFPLLFFLKYNTEETNKQLKIPKNKRRRHYNVRTVEDEYSMDALPVGSGCEPSLHHNDDDDIQRENTLTIREKFYAFYTAPFVIFVLNIMSYIAFLFLYSYLLLIELKCEISNIDILLITWVVTLTLEEFRQLISSSSKSVKSKLQAYIQDPWNKLDVITILLFIIGMAIRSGTLEGARVVLGINLMTFYFRILHTFSVFKNMGPKLVMIAKMFWDLLYFVIILMVIVVAYAITTHSILFPNAALNKDLIMNVFKTAYWNLYGELFLDDLQQQPPQCTFEPALYTNNTLPRCPTKTGIYVGHIMLGVYVLFSNILLLNLLIAMFSYTFQKIQDNTDLYWCFQRYYLVHEYRTRPSLPPPLILIIHVYRLLKLAKTKICRCRCCGKDRGTKNDRSYAKYLRTWEFVLAANLLQRKEIEENERCDKRFEDIREKLFTMSKHMNIMLEDMSKKLDVVKARLPPSSLSDICDSYHLPSILSPGISLISQTEGTSKTYSGTRNNHEQERPTALRYSDSNQDAENTKENTDKKTNNSLCFSANQHCASRSSPYPGTTITREPVPDDKIRWSIPLDNYKPPEYEAAVVKKEKFEVDLLKMTPEDRMRRVTFNTRGFLNRMSAHGSYNVLEGLPLNPVGRTGIMGRGALYRWGPNFAADCIITRWKSDQNGQKIFKCGYPVFELICVKTFESTVWSLPGVVLKPGEMSEERMKEVFVESVLGSNTDSIVRCKVDTMFTKFSKIYKGYADDNRNTDNAWIETTVYHYHDNDFLIVNDLPLKPGKSVADVQWVTASPDILLSGAHSEFVKKAAETLDASYETNY